MSETYAQKVMRMGDLIVHRQLLGLATDDANLHATGFTDADIQCCAMWARDYARAEIKTLSRQSAQSGRRPCMA